MANEIINPIQQFLQFSGQPNANGQIEFFTDSGKLTQKDIFSDSALTIAQSNPYTLDDSGQIIGDVHYDGSATLVHTDVTGFEFRQDDDVVISSDGQAGSITISEASVASMRANQTLIEGNVVRTRGYYSPNLYGGARYVVVAAATGTVDNFLFHQLGNGLQVKLIDLEKNNRFLVAGARGDGSTNDTNAMQNVINRGGDVVVESGFIFVASNLSIPKDIRFMGTGTMKQRSGGTGDFIRITDVSVRYVKFRDVTLDGNQPSTTQGSATVGWAI